MKYTFLLIPDSSPKINFADNKTVFKYCSRKRSVITNNQHMYT